MIAAARIAALAALLTGTPWALDDGFPEGFKKVKVLGPMDEVIAIQFDPQGTLWIGQKSGRIWAHSGGVTAPQPLIDISEEVGNWSDHGLMGFALDPDYAANGFVYLLYVVDYHHLIHSGTPAYQATANEFFRDTIGRVTRYTALDPGDPFTTVDPASRLVLVGENLASGIPICSNSHGLGAMLFGEDGTLLLSTGDSRGSGQTTGTCLEEGILTPKEDVDAFRSQLVDGRNGRVWRIDPGTGDGLSSNPFFDPLDPRSGRSRTWVLGLRNPFRMGLRPGTGSPDPAAGDPGTLYIGDVGMQDWEELDVAVQGGLNFGWPLHEGVLPLAKFAGDSNPNLDAPNPLFGLVVPGLGLCDQAYFDLADLLAQDSLNALSWPNPCDPLQPIPPSVHLQVHTRPVLAWGHEDENPVPVTLVPTYDLAGEASEAGVGDPSSPVPGTPFFGNCSVAGEWYTGTAWPAGFQDAYYHADFGEKSIQRLRFDAADRLVSVEPFAQGVSGLVDLAYDPVGESLHYITYSGGTGSRVYRIEFGGNAPPEAVIAVEPEYGPEPLRVFLSGAGSSDPEDEPLAYAWDFGDGSPPSPVDGWAEAYHVYPSVDVTGAGAIVSRLDELSPPTPMGAGSPDPEVIRDGLYPAVGSTEPAGQFDTQHHDGQGVPDKGGVDWIGYAFPVEETFLGLTFQQGVSAGGDGGWFDELRVQVRDAQTGVWSDVSGLLTWPAYSGAGSPSFATFQLLFEPAAGDGIRLYGAPGGSLEYVSVGELRALASPAVPLAGPAGYAVGLTVSDDVLHADQAVQGIAVNDTPPQVQITSPVHGSSYPVGVDTVVDLAAALSDAEHAAAELACEWNVALVHDNHEHPEPSDPACSSTFTIQPHGELQGDSIHWRFELTVTDPLGLATTVEHALVPEDDCDLDGLSDSVQLATGAVQDCDGDGSPDACDFLWGGALDLNGNGTPDGCESLQADVGALSLAAGGTQALTVDVGPAFAGDTYLIAGTGSGTEPGFVVDGVAVPLNVPDPYFDYTLLVPNEFPFEHTLGFLDAAGRAGATLTAIPGSDPAAVGLVLHHAAVVFDLSQEGVIAFATNAMPLAFEP